MYVWFNYRLKSSGISAARSSDLESDLVWPCFSPTDSVVNAVDSVLGSYPL
jgi:hypothetical protein